MGHELCLLPARLGLRLSECADLRVADVDLDQNVEAVIGNNVNVATGQGQKPTLTTIAITDTI